MLEYLLDNTGKWTNKDKINALKLVKETETTRFEVLQNGPATLYVQQLQEKVNELIETKQQTQQNFFKKWVKRI